MDIHTSLSGNNRHSFNLSAQGPKTSPKELWGLENFEAKSAPFVFENVLYISKDQSLVAIESKTGKIKWEISIPGQASSPVIFNDMLLFGGYYIDNFLYGVDKETGREIFKFRTGLEGAGVHKSPIIEDGKMIFAAGKTVYALDVDSRKVAWKLKTTQKVDNSPVTAGDGIIFKTAGDTKKSKLYGVSVSDGNEVCKIPLKIKCTSALLYHQQHLFFTDLESNLNILNPISQTIQSFKVFEGASSQHTSYLAAKDGNLIISIGYNVASLNLAAWNWNWVVHSKGVVGQPIIADNVVYFATCFDGIYGLNFETGSKLFQIETGVRSKYACSVEDGILYMAGSMSERQLIAYK